MHRSNDLEFFGLYWLLFGERNKGYRLGAFLHGGEAVLQLINTVSRSRTAVSNLTELDHFPQCSCLPSHIQRLVIYHFDYTLKAGAVCEEKYKQT